MRYLGAEPWSTLKVLTTQSTHEILTQGTQSTHKFNFSICEPSLLSM